MTDPLKYFEPDGLRVTLDRLMYQAHLTSPPAPPHCFIYFISIHNDSDLSVTIKGRKWVVTSETGEITAIEGDGVVGQNPEIQPGEKFSYNSFHLVEGHRAFAEGSYIGVDALGRTILARIPRFEMVVPS